MIPQKIIDAGKPCAIIRLPATPSPVLETAATELQSHLRLMSGAELPVVRGEPRSPAEITIHLGRSPDADRLLGPVDWAALETDGVLVRSVPGALILAGANERGTLYAVYEFLDRHLGCRWLPRGVTHLPRRKTIDVAGLDILYRPVFRYREPFFSCAFDPQWAQRNRVNGHFFPLTESDGGRMKYAGFVHTYSTLVPPKTYFEKKPEYFSEVDGKRVPLQLCLSHPDVLEITLRSVRQQLAEDPDARIVSISQNDCNGYCTCPSCRKLDEAEGTPAASIVTFVNAVAERLEKEFPHILFDTLAYAYGIVPPKTIRPRKNVIIRLCHLNGPCDAHPIESCAMNRDYREQIRQWTAISSEVFVWDYFNDFAYYFMPYPNLDAVCADIALYARSGVTGIFCQGDAQPMKGSGDMAELRAWLCARLLWRPDLNGSEVIGEFLRLYYGPAAGSIRKYLDLLHDPCRKGAHITPYMPPASDVPFLAPAILKQARALFAGALRRAGVDAGLRARIEAARLPLDFIEWRSKIAFRIARNRYESTSPALLKKAKRFMFKALSTGCEGLSESERWPIRENILALDGAPTVTVKGRGLNAIVCPQFGGRVLVLKDPRKGFNWLHEARSEEPGFPIAGGYEEYTERHWRSSGWQTPFVAHPQKSGWFLSGLATRDLYGGGLVFERTMSIERTSQGPAFQLVTILKNQGFETASICLRLHLELEAGDWNQARLQLFNPDGSCTEWTEWTESKNNSGSRVFAGPDKPAGQWAWVRGNRRLVMAFPSDSTEQVLATYNRNWQVMALDLYGPTRKLLPGEGVTYVQRWRPESINPSVVPCTRNRARAR
jgi:hypothetical protein